MITIDNPSLRTKDGAATISYPILQDGQAPRTLSFTVDSRFRDFLNPGRADGAIVALLPWISRQGGLVRILPAISPRLYHFGIRLLSHILTGIGPFLKPVELVGEVNAEALSPIPGRRIGTGGSLGGGFPMHHCRTGKGGHTRHPPVPQQLRLSLGQPGTAGRP